MLRARLANKWSKMLFVVWLATILVEWLTFPEEPIPEKMVESIFIALFAFGLIYALESREKKRRGEPE